MNPWIEWTKQIKAISQIGATYSKDKYALERYDQLSEIAHQKKERPSVKRFV